MWALEVPGASPFAGFVGLSVPRFEAHFTPAVEIGWRLAAEYWGRGYATEGARAVLAYGFETLHLDEIVAFTTSTNLASHRVMSSPSTMCAWAGKDQSALAGLQGLRNIRPAGVVLVR